MYLQVEKIIKDIFPLRTKNNHDQAAPLILGLSGGPDSMALFYILKKLQKDYAFYLVSAHVNHMFRGAEADQEEETLKLMAIAEDEILETLRIDVTKIAQEEKLSKQDAGHRVRRDYFIKLAKKYGGKYIALAHHGDDRVESFFIHLFHGSGAQGLSALPILGDYHEDLQVLRPLMNFSKDQILEFCHKENIAYFTDLSNQEPHYKRNKIRLELIPLLEREYNSKIKDVILGSMEILEDENTYLDKITEENFKEIVRKEDSKYLLDRGRFKELDMALQRRLLIYMLKKENLNYNREKITKIISLLNEEKGQQSYRISQEWILKIVYDTASLEEDSGDFELKSPGETQSQKMTPILIPKISDNETISINQGNLEFIFSLEEFNPSQAFTKEKGEDILWLDKNLLEDTSHPLTLRPRQEGDIIKPLKGKTKTLKKYLMEMKIPSSQRDDLILLAYDQEILWIPFLTFSHNYGLTKNNLEQSEKKMLKVVCKVKESLKKDHQCDKVY